MTRFRPLFAALVVAALPLSVVPAGTTLAVSPSVVISQIYGTGAIFDNDYIELHNTSSSSVDMDGWSVQVGGSADPPGLPYSGITPLTDVTIGPGAYFLIQEAGNFGPGAALPTPDATGSIHLDTAGAVALRTSGTICPATTCVSDSGTLDFVGYGNWSAYEGTATAPYLSQNGAIFRVAAGEQDTDDNHADFVSAFPSPRNSASTPIDKLGPVAAVNALGAFQKQTSFTVGWSATDPSGVAAYESRARHATPSAGFSSNSSWYGGAGTSSTYSAAAGQTVCVSTKAQDTLGHWGAFSPERCTAVPLDDRALTATSFSRRSGTSYFKGTYSLSTIAGARLTSATITAKRLTLLATTCQSCGSVQVKWKGAVVGTFSLLSATTKYKVLIPVTVFPSLQAGVAQIVTLSSARVEIDGLGASRR